MKKRILIFITLLFSMISIYAQNYLIDNAKLLSKEEAKTLEARLSSISTENNVGIYVMTINDFQKYSENIEKASEKIFLQSKFNEQGLLFLISMSDRSYDLYANGTFNQVFNESKRTKLENAFLDDFADNRWFDGLQDFADKAESIILGKDVVENIIYSLIVSFVIALIIALILFFKEKGKLNNVAFATEANRYESEEGVSFDDKRDLFTHTTVRVIEHKNDSNSSSSSDSGHSSGHF